MPLAFIERASSSSASSRNRVRGWYGLGSIRSISICCGPADIVSRLGGATVPIAAGAGAGATCGSGSRMSAPSPRPSAFLVIGDYLLSELCVALGPFAVHIIENNRLTEARRLREPDIARNNTLKNLCAKKTAQIGGDLARKSGAFIIHREQDALNFEARI